MYYVYHVTLAMYTPDRPYMLMFTQTVVITYFWGFLSTEILQELKTSCGFIP